MEQAKSSSRKTAKKSNTRSKPKRRNSPAKARDASTHPTHDPEMARAIRERDEALQRETATSEILRLISGSPDDLTTIFRAILDHATRICGANFGHAQLYETGGFRMVAMHNAPSPYAEAIAKREQADALFRPGPLNVLTFLVETKHFVHTIDYREHESYKQRDPGTVRLVELGGARTVLNVPMVKDQELIGAINIYRQEVRPFTDEQIALVQSFAAQAVIAIENARLLNELRQRTADLSEALDQRTATSEVLRIISSSPGELELVFQTILENATRICEAKLGNLYRFDGSTFLFASTVGSSFELIEHQQRRGPFRPGPGSILGRLQTTQKPVHCDDLAAESGFHPVAKLGGGRSSISVPMLKDNQLIGAITIYRQEVRPFAKKQIELLEAFAAQAVIAIENARLLKELRERTDQLQAQSQELGKLNGELERRVTAQVGEIERMGRLRRFLPPQVADLIIASGTEKQLESHRREITALFCDLRGFTGFSESADPEDVIALLREYHAAAGGIISKYSGTLERYAGDGVMVIFNDPVPVPQPALQAVQAALDMREALKALTDKWGRLGHDLGFGIGIAHGHATLGTIGFEGRFDYAAIGTVSNVASRLCDEAKPGQILITPRVLMAVEGAVIVDLIGEFTLKGIHRPTAVYNVVGTKPTN